MPVCCPCPHAGHVGFLARSFMARKAGVQMAEKSRRLALPSESVSAQLRVELHVGRAYHAGQ